MKVTRVSHDDSMSVPDLRAVEGYLPVVGVVA
jgi:hypothetical protein